MKILIIEGMATSGKSSLISNLTNLLNDQKVLVLGEADTHIPIMEKTDELHIEFFKSLINDTVKADLDLVIFNRLHYTPAYQAKVNVIPGSSIDFFVGENDKLKPAWRVSGKWLYEVGLEGRYNEPGEWKPLAYPGKYKEWF